MKITPAIRKRLITLLPNDYRQVIVDRLGARGITVHANTVTNVLAGSNNPEVAIELLKLGNEMKSSQKQFNVLVEQLSKEATA